MFATTQSQNFTRQSDKLMMDGMKKVMTHIGFAVQLCLMQAKAGRKFMIEQPIGASAWGSQVINKILFVKGAGKVNFDFCMFETKSADEREVRQARKRTSIISNSQALLTDMTKYQSHHVTMRGCKATRFQVYNDELCKTVCETNNSEKTLRAFWAGSRWDPRRRGTSRRRSTR